MKLDFTELLYALSFALDSIEQELTGVKSFHGKRVAYMSYLLAKNFGMESTELTEFVGCAILHDNAIAEYIREEFGNNYDSARTSYGGNGFDLKRHCISGERNISLLPFRTNVKNIILFHHGASGALKLKDIDNVNSFKSQIIEITDYVDTIVDLTQISESDFEKVIAHLKEKSDADYSEKIIELFIESVTYEKIREMNEVGVDKILRREVPSEMEEYSDLEIRNISETFAKIVDYKSSFTKNHSIGVAEKSDVLAKYYDFDADKQTRFYMTAAFHDIGKLIIPNDILEKPGKLSAEEFVQMKTHAYATYEVLHQIPGLEDIAVVAARHHEKLDGSGYPFGLKAEDLSFEEKLLACIDIYQALTESRPYKEGFSHEKSISIMKEMVENNQLEGSIVDDIEKLFGNA